MAATPEEIRELLERTLTHLSDKSKWRKDAIVVEDSACVVNTLSRESRLLTGGSEWVWPSMEAERVVLRAVGGDFLSVPSWNDHPKTTHQDVINVLQDAIKLVTSEDG